MLGVHRSDLTRRGACLDEGTADDEGFLVGECEGAAGLQGPQGREESHSSRERIQHNIAGHAREFDCFIRADGDLVHPEGSHLLGEKVRPRSARGQPHDPETVRIAGDHVQGLGPD